MHGKLLTLFLFEEWEKHISSELWLSPKSHRGVVARLLQPEKEMGNGSPKGDFASWISCLVLRKMLVIAQAGDMFCRYATLQALQYIRYEVRQRLQPDVRWVRA